MKTFSNKIIIVKGIQKDTKLLIGDDLVSNINDLNVIPKDTSGFIVIADKNVMRIHGDRMIKSLKKRREPVYLVGIEATEEKKTIGQVEYILSFLLAKGINRKFLLINFGGGIVSDIGGFAASILFRGIPYINIPTTLLSQVDAALGGKTGVNFRINSMFLKNMLGVINNPLAVVSDMDMLSTLPDREIKNGLGEMLKYSLISELIKISDLISLKDSLRDKKLVGKLVADCQNIKMEFVNRDLYDNMGIREKLNLGHTIGHGIESASNGRLSHGQSVATGIAAIAKISTAKGLLKEKTCENIINNIRNLELPVTIGKLNHEKILSSMKFDKKNGTFVLIKNIGELITGQKVEKSLIRSILKEMSI